MSSAACELPGAACTVISKVSAKAAASQAVRELHGSWFGKLAALYYDGWIPRRITNEERRSAQLALWGCASIWDLDKRDDGEDFARRFRQRLGSGDPSDIAWAIWTKGVLSRQGDGMVNAAEVAVAVMADGTGDRDGARRHVMWDSADLEAPKVRTPKPRPRK